MKFFQIVFLLFSVSFSFANSPDFSPLPASHIVRHTYFTLSYNEKNEQANWVFYALTDSMVLNAGEERSNNFRQDKKIASESAKSSDYTKSGYDRGHLCPAGDMGFNRKAMEESFLMSNISPQAPDFNRGIWKKLEEQVREWAKKERKLYVVTGPVFKNNKGSIGKEQVLVPGYYFKILYDPTDETKLIAFVLPNEKSDRQLTDYAVAVDEAEKLTGFDFFSQLPDSQENILESRVQLAGWFEGYAPVTPPTAVITKTETKTTQPGFRFFLVLILVILLVSLFIFIVGSRKKRKRRK